MSTTTRHFPRQQPNPTTGGVPDHNPTIRLGTFAEGQRAVPVTVTHSRDIGSFASVEPR